MLWVGHLMNCVHACVFVCVCGTCVFSGVCKNLGRDGDQMLNINGKHFFCLACPQLIWLILLRQLYSFLNTSTYIHPAVCICSLFKWRPCSGELHQFCLLCKSSTHSLAGKWSLTFFFHWLQSMNTHPWVHLALPVTGLYVDSCTLNTGSKSASSFLNS